ncbi:MAG: hypothetical protein A2Y73_07770 [Chloroflexi bacterium RBG_13_56_8]|nr:MAG: hypothetical protein A2Y73_07770 [Chloroflexi bacterium RBG_13_56_8]
MRSLNVKLLLAFLAVSLIGTTLVAVFIGRRTANAFSDFVFVRNQESFGARLLDYYHTHGSWEGVDAILSFAVPKVPGGKPGPMEIGASIALADSQGVVVVPGLGYRVGEPVPQTKLSQGVSIQVNGENAGTLIIRRGAFEQNPAEKLFLERINLALLGGTLGATGIALFLGVLLTRSLTRPLHELTTATRAVAAGNLEQRVPVRSRDELGQLAESFNQMSDELVRARDLRRQMTADIAHDLRTPLSVILGHAEALSDGVLPPSADTFHMIHDESKRLNRLVEDLRTLSLAEAGELPMTRRLIAPGALLERAVSAHAPHAKQRDISLQVESVPDLPEIDVDPDRIIQVLDNLLHNALRHTPTGGCISLSARRSPNGVQIMVRDSGPGITPEELPHIFERFYRGDKSRQRHDGGSGLGLAIARSLVEGHGGRIWAESEPGKGATFIVELPCAETGDA